MAGSIYLVIRSSVDAYRKGNVSMEVYQSVRVGMDRMLTDLRRAVSPQSIWNDMIEDEETLDEYIDQVTGEAPPEPEPRDIIFQGSVGMVRFVTEDVFPRGVPGFDLREVVYRVDRDRSGLRKEIRDSVIRRRLSELRAERTANETDYRAAHPEEFEWTGEGESLTVANNVVEMTLAYYDGKAWRDSWDSEAVANAEEINRLPEEERDAVPEEKLGLPDAVAVTLVLSNGDEVAAITEIPARDLDLLIAVNETAFGMREFHSRVANNREQNVRPRLGERAGSYRAGVGDGLRIGSDQRRDARRRALRSDREGIRRGSGASARRPSSIRRASRGSRGTRYSSRPRGGTDDTY